MTNKSTPPLESISLGIDLGPIGDAVNEGLAHAQTIERQNEAALRLPEIGEAGSEQVARERLAESQAESVRARHEALQPLETHVGALAAEHARFEPEIATLRTARNSAIAAAEEAKPAFAEKAEVAAGITGIPAEELLADRLSLFYKEQNYPETIARLSALLRATRPLRQLARTGRIASKTLPELLEAAAVEEGAVQTGEELYTGALFERTGRCFQLNEDRALSAREIAMAVFRTQAPTTQQVTSIHNQLSRRGRDKTPLPTFLNELGLDILYGSRPRREDEQKIHGQRNTEKVYKASRLIGGRFDAHDEELTDGRRIAWAGLNWPVEPAQSSQPSAPETKRRTPKGKNAGTNESARPRRATVALQPPKRRS